MARTTSPAPPEADPSEPFFSAEAFAGIDPLSLFKPEPTGEVVVLAVSATRHLEIQKYVRGRGESPVSEDTSRR